MAGEADFEFDAVLSGPNMPEEPARRQGSMPSTGSTPLRESGSVAPAAFALQQIHVIPAPRFVQPMFEAAAQRRKVRNDERDAKRQHPEAENRQESDHAARHQEQTQ